MQEKIHAKMNDILESSDAATLIKLHDFLELAVESYVDLETIVQHVKRAMDKEIEKEAAYYLGKGGE